MKNLSHKYLYELIEEIKKDDFHKIDHPIDYEILQNYIVLCKTIKRELNKKGIKI